MAGHRGHRRRPRLVLLPARLAGPRAGSTGWSAASGCAAAGATRERVYVGETIDFWRVEEREPGALLRLRAEMRLPGLAWLELGVETGPASDARSTYVQRALFHPRGLLGHAYWWAVAPFHGIVFGGMARNIAAAAERRSSSERQVV